MSKIAFISFIENAARFDMPVRFLQQVANSSYTIIDGSSSQVNSWLNIMTLDSGDLASAARAKSMSSAAAIGVLNLYHEATHAWLDLNERRPDVSSLIERGVAHYHKAPLIEGRTADEPDRVFQEAMGEYVGRRASVYWRVWAKLSEMEQALRQKAKMNEHSTAVALRAARQARIDYDHLMAVRVFGYQNQGWFQQEAQKPTLRPMSEEMKDFADRVLLENKIPAAFLRTTKPAQLWDKLRRENFPLLED